MLCYCLKAGEIHDYYNSGDRCENLWKTNVLSVYFKCLRAPNVADVRVTLG